MNAAARYGTRVHGLQRMVDVPEPAVRFCRCGMHTQRVGLPKTGTPSTMISTSTHFDELQFARFRTLSERDLPIKWRLTTRAIIAWSTLLTIVHGILISPLFYLLTWHDKEDAHSTVFIHILSFMCP